MCRTVLSNSAPLFFHENERCNAQQLHETLLLQVCAFEVNEEALYRASWISSAATTAAGIAPVAKHWSSSIAAATFGRNQSPIRPQNYASCVRDRRIMFLLLLNPGEPLRRLRPPLHTGKSLSADMKRF